MPSKHENQINYIEIISMGKIIQVNTCTKSSLPHYVLFMLSSCGIQTVLVRPGTCYLSRQDFIKAVFLTKKNVTVWRL